MEILIYNPLFLWHWKLDAAMWEVSPVCPWLLAVLHAPVRSLEALMDDNEWTFKTTVLVKCMDKKMWV